MAYLPESESLANAMIPDEDGAYGEGTMDLEQILIGSCLAEPFVTDDVRTVIPATAFQQGRNRNIWHVMCEIADDPDQQLDLVTTTERLRDRGALEKNGGAYYLSECMSEVASPQNATYYASILKERYLKRRLYGLMRATQHAMTQKEEDVDAVALIEEVQSEIHNITNHMVSRRPESLKEVAGKTIDAIKRAQEMQGVTGVPTGLHRLDDITGGWQDSDLIVVAARPGMGKSTLISSFAWNAATHHDGPRPGLICTLEMPNKLYAQRIACAVARLDGDKARKGRLSDKEMQHLEDTKSRLEEAPIWFSDDPSMTFTTLASRARKLYYEQNIEWLAIDYLQLLTTEQQHGSREQEIAHISRGLKALAKELDIPVIAAAQLNRGPENRQDKRPKLFDLRESGQIEQDCDVVIGMYRANYYGIEQDERGNPTEHQVECIVLKQRSGPTGVAHLGWLPKYPEVVNPVRIERMREEEQVQLQQQSRPRAPLPEANDDAPF